MCLSFSHVFVRYDNNFASSGYMFITKSRDLVLLYLYFLIFRRKKSKTREVENSREVEYSRGQKSGFIVIDSRVITA